jgi:RNA ligase (TIGR02306 family)
MSEFHVAVVRVGPVEKHPNADTLSMTKVHGGYPVLFRTGEFKEGDLAVYVPVDAVVPDAERWAFLGEHRRIKAKRLRGIFSMGLLTSIVGLPQPDVQEGDEAGQALGITKYEPPEQFSMGGENERDPQTMPVYDIEGLRKFGSLLQHGESVWISEKIHGANARFVHDGERLWVGSHRCIKKESETNLWWKVARKYDLAAKLATIPSIAVYGEVYGQVQDLEYGVPASEGARLAIFDALDTKTRRWFGPEELNRLCVDIGLEMVPTIYIGEWDAEFGATLAEGKSTIPGADHIREGIVVKPMTERVDPVVGRVFLKLAGEGYLTRKAA